MTDLQHAFDLFETYRADWLTTARAFAYGLGQGGKIVTIDDVRKVCPPPPEVDPRVMGAVFERSLWQGVGYRQSTRKECHKRPIREFQLRELKNDYEEQPA